MTSIVSGTSAKAVVEPKRSDSSDSMEEGVASKRSSSNSHIYSHSQVSNLEENLKKKELLANMPKSDLWKVKMTTLLNGIDSLLLYNTILNCGNPIKETLFPGQVWNQYWNTALTIGSILTSCVIAYSHGPTSLNLMKFFSMLLFFGFIICCGVIHAFVLTDDDAEYSDARLNGCVGATCVCIFIFACAGQFIQNNSYSVSAEFCSKGSVTKYEVLGEGFGGIVAWLAMLQVKFWEDTRKGQIKGIWVEFLIGAIFPLLNFIMLMITFRKGSKAQEYMDFVAPGGFILLDPERETKAKLPRDQRASFIQCLIDAKLEVAFLGLVMFGTLTVFPTFLPYGMHFEFNDNAYLLGIFIIMDVVCRLCAKIIEKIRMPFWLFASAVILRQVFLDVCVFLAVVYKGIPVLGTFWFACIDQAINVLSHSCLFTYNIFILIRATNERNAPKLGSVICLTVQFGLLGAWIAQICFGYLPSKEW